MKNVLILSTVVLILGTCVTEPEFSGSFEIHKFYRSQVCSCGPSTYEVVFGNGMVYTRDTYKCDNFIVIEPFVGNYLLEGSHIKLFGTRQTWLEEATFELFDDVIIGRWETKDDLIEVILTRR